MLIRLWQNRFIKELEKYPNRASAGQVASLLEDILLFGGTDCSKGLVVEFPGGIIPV